jgi:nitroreductase
MVDAKCLIWRDEPLRGQRRSGEALQELRPPALNFLPVLMMYNLSRRLTRARAVSRRRPRVSLQAGKESLAATWQPYVGDASAIVLYTAVLERSLWKYTDRGYRYILFETGHVAQNVNLVAESLGLGSLNLGGFFDDQIAAFLGIDTDEEVPLYATALGVPADRDRSVIRRPEAIRDY